MSAHVRAQLLPEQVRALRVGELGIEELTSYQIKALSVEQIQSLPFNYFHYLNRDQIKQLTGTQIQAIPHSRRFTQIPDDVRAQLTDRQIQQLTVSRVSIRHLTPRQRAALTPAQIQTIPGFDVRFLLATQAQHVTPEQISSIEHHWYFQTIPAEVRARFRREQLLALDEGIKSELVGLPPSFVVPDAEQTLDGEPHIMHPDDSAKQHEHSAILALVPHEDAEFVSAQTGNWSDPATWASHSVPSLRTLRF